MLPFPLQSLKPRSANLALTSSVERSLGKPHTMTLALKCFFITTTDLDTLHVLLVGMATEYYCFINPYCSCVLHVLYMYMYMQSDDMYIKYSNIITSSTIRSIVSSTCNCRICVDKRQYWNNQLLEWVCVYTYTVRQLCGYVPNVYKCIFEWSSVNAVI